MGDFDGKVILITGGATGLGAAMAIGALNDILRNPDQAAARRRAQMTFAIYRQQAACMVELGVMPHCREHVQNLAVVCRRVANAIGRNHRQLQRLRNL